MGVSVVAAQTPVRARDRESVAAADSLRQAGRPWHAAELLLAAAARDPTPNANFVVQGAAAELGARRYDRARNLLIGRPWLEDYDNGRALAVLAAAEARLGMFEQAAMHFSAARQRAVGADAAIWGVHAGLAWEQLGARDSAASAFAAALNAGLQAIAPWLRLREARVVSDTARAARLLADLPPPASRDVPSAWAQALLAAGDSLAALDHFVQAGRSLDAGRLALRLGDSTRARSAVYALMARAPESDDAAARSASPWRPCHRARPPSGSPWPAP
jgi:tetratricopeptide (TPR) repeat protein